MNVKLVSKVALGLFVGTAGLGLAAGLAFGAPPTFIPGWGGQIFSSTRQAYNSFREYNTRFDVFVDNNGCEYIVARSSRYEAVSVAITPRIDASTKMPYCRSRQ